MSMRPNAMQSFSEDDCRDTLVAVDAARDHIETDLHREVLALRADIADLRGLLGHGREGPAAG